MRIDESSLSWIASDADRSKLRLPGTDRTVPPAVTLERAREAAVRAGVTRLADVTRLDVIGIATYQAIRPTATTLTVSQGKGVTAELAQASALMEAIEVWHFEQPLTPAVTATPRAIEAELSYPPAELALAEGSVLHDDLPLDWVEARSLRDGTRTLIPTHVVGLAADRRTGWNPPVFFESTNGLASGNTTAEATLHALYEVVERDATTAAVAAGGHGVPVAPRTLGSPVVDDLCRRIEAADVRLDTRHVPSRTGLPCFLASVASDDYPTAMFGFGCHREPEIALTRALTEAVQCRLAYIAGSRDDLVDELHEPPRRREVAAADVLDLVSSPVRNQSLLEDLEDVVERVTAAYGHAPLVVSLARDDVGIPVVRVVAPGSRICEEVI